MEFNSRALEEREDLTDWVYKLTLNLYENEMQYAKELYNEIGWTENVRIFMQYNADKALMNLGIEPLFGVTAADVDPLVMNGLSTTTSNHDFFSQVGNGYLLSDVEVMKDEDYDY